MREIFSNLVKRGISLLLTIFAAATTLSAQSPQELYERLQRQKVQFADESRAANEELAERRAAEASLVLLQDAAGLLPLASDKYERIAVVEIAQGDAEPSAQRIFSQRFNDYFKADIYTYNYKERFAKASEIVDSLKRYNLVVLNFKPYLPDGDSAAALALDNFISLLMQMGAEGAESGREIVIAVSSKEMLERMPAWPERVALLYSDTNAYAQDLLAQALCGAFDLNGRLAEQMGSYKRGAGMDMKGGIRFKFTIGEEVGINSALLEHNVDSIILGSIRNGAFPGCQLIIAKDQKIIFNGCYGYHTFAGLEPVKSEDMYDLASNTKVSAATPLYMQLYDKGSMDLDVPISNYLPGLGFEESNKKDVTLRRLLAHIAGFQPFYAFYADAAKEGLLSEKPSEKFPVRIDTDLWASDQIYEFVYKKIRDLPLTEPNKMKYSCLGFVLSAKIIENISGENFHTLLQKNIYGKLEAPYTMYNPWTNGTPLSNIIPTEVDNEFRHKLVHGFVHDETSALVGGYSSNAGLFSNAMGVAKLFQMYLNKGTYGGVRFFSEETFDTFNKQYYLQYSNYRGLGLEKPTAENAQCTIEEGWPAPSASQSAFGHSGFTGTYIWAEPENGTLYVFLSNRVYPTRKNRAFDKMQARVGIHELIYQLLK